MRADPGLRDDRLRSHYPIVKCAGANRDFPDDTEGAHDLRSAGQPGLLRKGTLRDRDFLQGPASAEPGDQAHPEAAEQKGAWNGNDAWAGRGERQVVETDIDVSAV
jgi:hypothetical protein